MNVRAEYTDTGKRCLQCGEMKPFAAFAKRTASTDGLRPDCRECKSKRTRKYRVENLEKVRAGENAYNAAHREVRAEYADEWRRLNPEKHRAGQIKWAKENPEKVAAKAARDRAKNPEKHRERGRRFRRENPHLTRIHKQERRAREINAKGELSRDIVQSLFAKQQGKCVYCPADLTQVKYHLDHKMPLKLGGVTEDSNMQLLCPRCNLRKSAKHPDVFAQQMSKGQWPISP